nr:hypothetical protein [Tanacetum cinerariifolium]
MDFMNRLPVKSLLQFCAVSKQCFRNFDSNLNVFSLKPVASSEGPKENDYGCKKIYEKRNESVYYSVLQDLHRLQVIPQNLHHLIAIPHEVQHHKTVSQELQ